ncbi:MAG: hypothetical protein ACKVJ3_06730, partial [bacterium]
MSTNLLAKQLLLVLLLVIMLSLAFIFIASPGYSQETSEAKFQESLEEDPLAEQDADLGIEEDPLAESDADLGLEEDPLAESDGDLGLEEDPLDGESPEFEESAKQETEEQLEDEEEDFPPRVTFSHEVKTMIGGSETKGLSVLEPLLSEIKELRLVTTYDQSVKIQTSP